MKKDIKIEFRYYTPLIMGFFIMCVALFAPPIGVVNTSAIYAGGCFLILCAAVVGLDIPALLHEINELKRLKIEETKKEE